MTISIGDKPTLRHARHFGGILSFCREQHGSKLAPPTDRLNNLPCHAHACSTRNPIALLSHSHYWLCGSLDRLSIFLLFTAAGPQISPQQARKFTGSWIAARSGTAGLDLALDRLRLHRTNLRYSVSAAQTVTRHPVHRTGTKRLLQTQLKTHPSRAIHHYYSTPPIQRHIIVGPSSIQRISAGVQACPVLTCPFL